MEIETVAERKQRLAEAKKREEELLIFIADLYERKKEAEDVLALSKYLDISFNEAIDDEDEAKRDLFFDAKIMIHIGDAEVKSYMSPAFFDNVCNLLDTAYYDIVTNPKKPNRPN